MLGAEVVPLSAFGFINKPQLTAAAAFYCLSKEGCVLFAHCLQIWSTST